ncbi:MAG: CheR family methyltransferase, partial [Opitutaceae bacterium]
MGASAGGLEAFTQLLEHLPLDTGFGFVLVQHLDPEHPSALAKLLQQVTAMPVRDVTNNLRVEPNHIYIIPPNKNLGIAGGVLRLQPRSAQRITPRAIDHFLEALAKDQGERAIGVILSGTATDGTLGLEAIKTEGGLTFAQDRSARYDSMPRSAVDAGCVDFVLSPAGIAKELAHIARHPHVKAPSRARSQRWNERAGALDEKSPDGTEPTGYRKVLQLLRNHSGVDFSLYKYATIHRRITRRMVLNRQDSQGHYANFLRGNAKELDALYSDALISVTSFFRNAEAFEVLKRKVFAPLLKERSDEPVRVWVLGCSTGQEAYSIAMAYAEAAQKVPRARKLSVFATDLKETNLDKARHGLYAKSLVADVSPERLRRFFIEEDGGYRVIKSLREHVVFARHNLISDPPFSRMDLICCRNVMIYLEPSLQKKALPAFHYALKPGGCLFLGASESVGGFTDLFNTMDKRQKIFTRKAAPTLAFHLPVRERSRTDRQPKLSLRVPAASPLPPGGADDSFRGELNAEREADRVTINQFAPPGVLIDADLQILQFRGSTGPFLEPPTGKARFDLLKMARDGLMLPLRTAINRAKKDNAVARKENVPVLLNGRIRPVNIEVVPLKNLKERRFLVLFEDAENPPRSVQPPEAPPSGHPTGKQAVSRRIVSLEQDLAETRDYLETIQEQQEAANEELQSANEEGQSANEELQSLNEELETSKEELESTNEELTTVNEEMTHRNQDLYRLNSDLTNLQTSTNLAIVLLGRDLTISRFSVQAGKLFNLRAGDIGRPISEVRHNLQLPNLDAIITRVITTMREYEHEVQAANGHWFSLRLRPYLTIDNRVDGAVLVLVDITDLKKTQRLVTEAHEHAAAIIRTVHDPLVILNSQLRLQSANAAFYRSFRLSLKDAQDRSLFELDHGAWNIPRLRQQLLNVLMRHGSFDNFEVTHTFAKLGRRTLVLNARRLNEEGGHAKQILLGIRDVTELRAFEADLRRSETRYRRLFEASKDGILILDPATRKITDANPSIVKLLGFSRQQLIKKELWQIGLL